MPRFQLIITSTPAICGLLLLATSHLDLYLFQQGAITARQAVGHEFVFLGIGFLAITIQLLAGLIWLIQRRWKLALVGTASSITFLILVLIAGFGGAAFLNAA